MGEAQLGETTPRSQRTFRLCRTFVARFQTPGYFCQVGPLACGVRVLPRGADSVPHSIFIFIYLRLAEDEEKLGCPQGNGGE